MSVAIAITVTFSKFTASTLPGLNGNRTMAATDLAITDFAESVRRQLRNQFVGVDPTNADADTTVAVTVT